MDNKAIKNIYEWVRLALISLGIIFLLLTFAFRMVYIDGLSMRDTLKDGQRVIATNFMYTPKNGDIVAISHGENLDKPLIKRIIATAGQSIEIDINTGNVCVNGVVIQEEYIKNRTTNGINWDFPKVVPQGKVFVMGDNRQISKDSRNSDIGFINETDIIGKAQVVVFPFTDIKYLYN